MSVTVEWPVVLRAAGRTVSTSDHRGLLALAVTLGTDVAAEVVGCSLTVAAADTWTTPCASQPVATVLDGAQYDAGSGPCIEAATTGVAQELDVIATDGRFRGFAAAAAAHGVRSSLSVPLPGAPERSALNLYASRPGAFDSDHSRDVARLLAKAVAALLGAPVRPAPDRPTPDAATDEELAAGRGATVRAAVRLRAARTGTTAEVAYQELAERTRRESCSMVELAARILAGDGPVEVAPS